MWVALAVFEVNNKGIENTIKKNRLSINFAMLKIVKVYISCKIIFYNLLKSFLSKIHIKTFRYVNND
jgi:hypothetical protein